VAGSCGHDNNRKNLGTYSSDYDHNFALECEAVIYSKFTVKMETVHSSETSVNTYKTTWHYIQNDSNFRSSEASGSIKG
jgi:hypothetical protein